jgi:hypothetical protein
MSERTDGWDDEDRAIARALDASADADLVGVNEALVDEYRDVLAELAPESTPRPGLEDDVVAAAIARRPAAAPSVDRGRRRANRVRIAVLAAAVAAGVFVAGLIVNERSTGNEAPTAHISLTTVQRADVEALLRAPGTRSGVFRPALPTGGRVALGTSGKGIVYDLRSDAPVSFGLISQSGSTIIGPARAVGGAIAFVVDHPERVTSVDLIRNGATIGRARLTMT